MCDYVLTSVKFTIQQILKNFMEQEATQSHICPPAVVVEFVSIYTLIMYLKKHH
jgi:hypothetical protein